MSVSIVYSGTGGQWLGIKRTVTVSIDSISPPWWIEEEEEFKQLVEGAVDSIMQVCVCGHWKKDHRHTQVCKQCRQCKGFRKQGKRG